SLLLGLAVSAGKGEDKPPPFREQVRPIPQRCVNCHSGDEPAASLNLSTQPLALKGGESGPALRPGRAADSLLFSMVSSKKMPPKKPLGTEEIALLRRWIDDGAAWEGTVERVRTPVTRETRRAGPDWWSLQSVRRPSLPPPPVPPPPARGGIQGGWARTPVATFILANLEAGGLRPAPPAARPPLLRRVPFDLIGLPPTPAAIDAFVNDPSPDAYERVVE